MTLVEKFQTETGKFLKTRIHNYHKDNGGEHKFVNSMIVNAYSEHLIKDGCMSALSATESFNAHARIDPFIFESLWMNDSMQVTYQFVYYAEEIDCYFDIIFSDGEVIVESNLANEDISIFDIEDGLVEFMIKEVSVANSFGLLKD